MSVAIRAAEAVLDPTVLDWNAPSIAFHGSIGARAMDAWKVYRLDGDPLRKLAG